MNRTDTSKHVQKACTKGQSCQRAFRILLLEPIQRVTQNGLWVGPGVWLNKMIRDALGRNGVLPLVSLQGPIVVNCVFPMISPLVSMSFLWFPAIPFVSFGLLAFRLILIAVSLLWVSRFRAGVVAVDRGADPNHQGPAQGCLRRDRGPDSKRTRP